MNIKKLIGIFSIVFMLLLCVSCASAAHDNDTLSTEAGEIYLENDTVEQANPDESGDVATGNNTPTEVNETGTTTNDTPTEVNATGSQPQTTKKAKKTLDALCSNAFIQKSNKYYTVKVCKFNEKKNKLDYYKNVKITVKVKIGSKTKTYNVKTNSKGEAKVFNIKNLKCGIYTVNVASNDNRYKIKEKGYIGIFSKKTKSITIKMNKRKKVKNDYIETFYITKNSQYPKGVYVDSYNAKNPHDSPTHNLITKAKFVFKNKKTGKIITKTIKSKTNKIYGWEYPETKLIKGYTPIKTTVWYAYC